MARLFISFLGTNNYISCNYYVERPEKTEVKDVRFVQEAIASIVCKTWNESDKILIFITEEAKKRNWLDNGHTDRKTKKEIPSEGLAKRLHKLNLKASIIPVSIDDGLDNDGIWNIFYDVYENIGDGDDVIFDITHAFRSIPMLAIVILNYAKALKNITISGIHYGPFEKLGKVEEVSEMAIEDRNVPILDLSAFDYLLDWSFGVERFVTSGDATKLSELMQQDINPLLRETQGKNQGVKNLDLIGKGLSNFSNIIATCRAPKLSSQSIYNKEQISKYQESELLPAFKPLIRKIEQGFEKFSGHPIADGLEASQWCLKHNFIQQGITLLYETMISHIVSASEGDYLNQNDRKVATHIASGLYHDVLTKKTARPESDELSEKITEYRSRVMTYLTEKIEFTKMIGDLGQNIRNDINHAGYRDGAKKPEDFRMSLSNFIDKFEAFLRSI